MIINEKDIKHARLRAFWASGGKDTKGLPADQVKRIRTIMVHLHTARSLNDIAEGLGKQRKHHKLSGHDSRYAMWVTGNDRITYDCHDSSNGVVTAIDYEDYH